MAQNGTTNAYFCSCCGTITGKSTITASTCKDISISGYDTILHLENAVMYVLNVANDSMNV